MFVSVKPFFETNLVLQMTNLAIIEDCKHWRLVIKHYLQQDNKFNIVLNCGMGNHFFKNHKALNIDAIIVDISLPGENGFQVMRRLSIECPHIPFIVLTSSNNRSDYSKAFDCGAKAYIQKHIIANLSEELSVGLGLINRKNGYNHLPFCFNDLDLIEMIVKHKMTNEEIGAALKLKNTEPKKAVENMINRVCSKYNIRNKRLYIMEFYLNYAKF